MVLPGDGIGTRAPYEDRIGPWSFNKRSLIISLGPEVVAEAVKVLEAIFVESEVELKLEKCLFGGCAIDEVGEALPASTLQACKEADAILMGTQKSPTSTSTSALPPPTLHPHRLHRRPQMGRQQQGAPRAGPARPAQSARALREHPPRQLRLGLARRQLAAEGADHARRGHHRRARADRGHLLWRAQGAGRRTAPRRGVGHDGLQRRRGRAHHARRGADRPRVRAAPRGPLGRQGQRPRELAPLEESRVRDARARIPADRARPPARRLGRHGPGLQSAQAQRRRADGKFIRGHVGRFPFFLFLFALADRWG